MSAHYVHHTKEENSDSPLTSPTTNSSAKMGDNMEGQLIRREVLRRHSPIIGRLSPTTSQKAMNLSDESSPLLPSDRNNQPSYFSPQQTPANPNGVNRDNESGQSAAGCHPKNNGCFYMLFLTLSMLGLQMAWSVETSHGSPYLIDLGLSKKVISLVWIAGPLSGILVQPYVGAKSDRCTSKYGRRRPFMVGGAIATCLSLVSLVWAEELVSALFGLFRASEKAIKLATITWAIVMIYVLDFAINTLQAAIRAFIVDFAPTDLQDTANAWASRMAGVGNIIGFLIGSQDTGPAEILFEETQLQTLVICTCIILLGTLMFTCLNFDEEPLTISPSEDEHRPFAFFKDLKAAARNLPPQIKRVCWVQFFAWIGWFPVLFYTSTYIGEIYMAPRFAANPDMSKHEIKEIWDEATRLGSRGLLIFAITSFAASVALPWLVYKPKNSSHTSAEHDNNSVPDSEAATLLQESPDGSATASPQNGAAVGSGSKGSGISSYVSLLYQRYPIRHRDIPRAKGPFFTMPNTWCLSHVIFAVLTLATFFVHTTTGAIVLMAFIGVPWAMTLWAPFALIAEEISRLNDDEGGDDDDTVTGEEAAGDTQEPPQAGVVLGIHNVAIAAPQVIATLVSSFLFTMLEKPRGTVGDESVAWVFRFGGLCAFVAAFLTANIREDRVR